MNKNPGKNAGIRLASSPFEFCSRIAVDGFFDQVKVRASITSFERLQAMLRVAMR
jgi:hypothetical protein